MFRSASFQMSGLVTLLCVGSATLSWAQNQDARPPGTVSPLGSIQLTCDIGAVDAQPGDWTSRLRCRPTPKPLESLTSLTNPSSDDLKAFGASLGSSSLSLHITNNLATLESTRTFLKGLGGEAFAQRAAPNAFSIIKSAPWRGAVLAAAVVGGAIYVYEWVSGDNKAPEPTPINKAPESNSNFPIDSLTKHILDEYMQTLQANRQLSSAPSTPTSTPYFAPILHELQLDDATWASIKGQMNSSGRSQSLFQLTSHQVEPSEGRFVLKAILNNDGEPIR